MAGCARLGPARSGVAEPRTAGMGAASQVALGISPQDTNKERRGFDMHGRQREGRKKAQPIALFGPVSLGTAQQATFG